MYLYLFECVCAACVRALPNFHSHKVKKPRACVRVWLEGDWRACVCVCAYIHISIHTYTHTHTHTHRHKCMYVCIYIYAYTYTFINTYVQIFMHAHDS